MATLPSYMLKSLNEILSGLRFLFFMYHEFAKTFSSDSALRVAMWYDSGMLVRSGVRWPDVG